MAAPDVVGFYGMRGSGNWATDERPYNWRQKILQLFPNGDAPLTGIMSKLNNEVTDDPQFHWWEEPLALQAGDLLNSGVYIDANLSTAYATDAYTAGKTVYAKCAANTAKHFREGHVALLRVSTDLTKDKRGIVTGRVENGSSSYVAVKLLDADASNHLANADRIIVIGNVNEEGASMPQGVSYHPNKFTGYTQIWRTPLRMTGTALSTKLRTEDAYKKMKRQVLQYHGIEMERSILWNPLPQEFVGPNGKPTRISAGLIAWIKNEAADNCIHMPDELDTLTFKVGGFDALNDYLRNLFRYGRKRKLCLCGTGALGGVNTLAHSYGQVSLTPQSRAYGLQVVQWITPFGIIDLMVHPLFSQEATETNSMLFIEPENLVWRPLKGRDTMFKKDDRLDRGGAQGVDGIEEEYLTEGGLEIHHAITMGYVTGFGVDGTNS